MKGYDFIIEFLLIIMIIKYATFTYIFPFYVIQNVFYGNYSAEKI